MGRFGTAGWTSTPLGRSAPRPWCAEHDGLRRGVFVPRTGAGVTASCKDPATCPTNLRTSVTVSCTDPAVAPTNSRTVGTFIARITAQKTHETYRELLRVRLVHHRLLRKLGPREQYVHDREIWGGVWRAPEHRRPTILASAHLESLGRTPVQQTVRRMARTFPYGGIGVLRRRDLCRIVVGEDEAVKVEWYLLHTKNRLRTPWTPCIVPAGRVVPQALFQSASGGPGSGVILAFASNSLAMLIGTASVKPFASSLAVATSRPMTSRSPRKTGPPLSPRPRSRAISKKSKPPFIRLTWEIIRSGC